jgi:cystathionine gamma-synthase
MWMNFNYRLILTHISAILNPRGKYYSVLKSGWEREYEDNYWAEDAIFMERNSRDYASRVERINHNAEAICELLLAHPRGTMQPQFPFVLLT